MITDAQGQEAMRRFSDEYLNNTNCPGLHGVGFGTVSRETARSIRAFLGLDEKVLSSVNVTGEPQLIGYVRSLLDIDNLPKEYAGIPVAYVVSDLPTEKKR